MYVICFISISLVNFSLFYHFHCLACMQFMADDQINVFFELKTESKKEYNTIVCQHSKWFTNAHSQLLIIIWPKFANQMEKLLQHKIIIIISRDCDDETECWIFWLEKLLQQVIGFIFFWLCWNDEFCYFYLLLTGLFFVVPNYYKNKCCLWFHVVQSIE